MILKGRAIKLGDNINTDWIISGRYKFAITDMKELSKHIFEDIDEDFPAKITPGKSILVAGENFGCGSSREQAPLVIKESGIICVVAVNFARIFYRNAINIGLPLVEADTRKIKDKDKLSIDLNSSTLKDVSKQFSLSTNSLPVIMQKLLKDGGLVSHVKKNKGIKL